MRKLIIVLTILSSLLAFDIRAINSQIWKTNVEEVYQKPDRRSWGDIYSWSFNRKEFRKSYALVIGISDYTKSQDWPRLESPYSDAIRIRDFLIHDDGFDYVVTLTNTKATKQNINRYMEEVFPDLLTENDRFLFYFSGHGTQRIIEAATFGYLVLQNCSSKSYGEMITMEDIERWDRLLYPKRHVLFVLDCCFSGLAGQQRKSPPTDKTLERLSQYAHYLITAGTADEESVASLHRWNGSLFTDSFLKAALGSGDLSSHDYQADGVVSLKEMMKYIGDRIDDESSKMKSKNPLSKGIKMSPQISDLQNNEGEFFFISRQFKNKKAGNVFDNNLDYGWPVETKGMAEMTSASLQSNQIVMQASSESAKTSMPIIFRSKSTSLSIDDIKSFLKKNNFFDSNWTKTGRGIENQLIRQKNKGETFVIDNATGLMWQQSGSSNRMNYESAKQWIIELNKKGYANFIDWRLPTLEEAMSLIENKKKSKNLYIDSLFDKTQVYIWTSDLTIGDSQGWIANFAQGCAGLDYTSSVRGVRSIASILHPSAPTNLQILKN